MINTIQRGTHKARKEYEDDGWEFIDEWIGEGCYLPKGRKLLFAEMRVLVGYRKDRLAGRKIFPGQVYERQFNEYDGDVYTWRMKKDLFDMACKYNLFPEL